MLVDCSRLLNCTIATDNLCSTADNMGLKSSYPNEEYSFLLKDHFNITNYNGRAIECLGQNIRIGSLLSSISIIGASRFGDLETKVIIKYEDGMREITLKFPNWLASSNGNNPKEYHKFTHYHYCGKDSKIKQPVLWINNIKFPMKSIIAEIQLPINPLIVIVAITTS